MTKKIMLTKSSHESRKARTTTTVDSYCRIQTYTTKTQETQET